VLRAAESVLFIIPWGRHWLLGTTDTDWAFDRAHPAASRRDVDYILTQANRFLVRPLTLEDVQGVYAGLRPLLAGESETTSGLGREHAVVRPLPGLVITAGGKYTTYRLMARDSVDVAARDLERPVPPSCTEHVPLLGAGGYRAIADGLEEVAAASAMPPASVERLLGRYGSAVRDILALVARRPELSEPLEGAPDHLAAEVVYAASHEGALHLEDVLTRRTRISIETWDRGLAAAEPAARLLSGVLEWSEEQMRREVDYYRLRVEAEREAQEQPDDVVADAVRRRAPDIVPVVTSAG
jgi:glycerol-3-phosphate dehydrogenase